MNVLLLAFLLLLPQESFTRFTYCRETTRGPYESQCITLNPSGEGEARLKTRGGDEAKTSLSLSDGGRERFLLVLNATNFLVDGANYESKKKVADLGTKKLLLEMQGGKREASFNFSTLKEVTDLATFFDSLINQETILIDMNTALQFDRLSVPKRLDQIETELKANRIGDPQRLIPVLEKIEGDSKLVNFARTRATKLKQQLSTNVTSK